MRVSRRLIRLSLALVFAVRPAMGADLKDLYFGEALYHALQGRFFDAIQRLDTEGSMYRGLDQPELDTLHYHINNAEFSVGDFELNYRMHHRAGRAIKAVLEGAVDEAVRNEAAFRLARIHFQKGQLDDALQALARIKGTVPEEIKGDLEFLRANVYMATGQPGEAVKVLAQLKGNERLAGFVAYNLGIALLQDGRPQEAIEQLDKAGQLPAGDPAALAIRDKSNLVLGTMLFESGNFERARQALDRVHLEGPFSNQALLRAGWAEASAQPARSRAWFENGPSRWTRSNACLARSKLPDSNSMVPSTKFDLSRIARAAGSPAAICPALSSCSIASRGRPSCSSAMPRL